VNENTREEIFMNKFKWMPVLKTGTFKDKNGKVVTVKTEDLDRVIESTNLTSDPQLVVEHPKFDEVGFGAVAQLKRVGEILFALPKEVNDKFKKAVNDGKLPGRSVTLDEKTFALKNISFLPPEIKPAVAGLGDYSFSTSPLPSPYQGEGHRERLVVLKVYDLLGREIATLLNKNLLPGNYTINFSTDDYQLSSGIYFYKLQMNGSSIVCKMNLIK